jgi:hypothetical protein
MDRWMKLSLACGVMLAALGAVVDKPSVGLTGIAYIIAVVGFIIEDASQPLVKGG